MSAQENSKLLDEMSVALLIRRAAHRAGTLAQDNGDLMHFTATRDRNGLTRALMTELLNQGQTPAVRRAAAAALGAMLPGSQLDARSAPSPLPQVSSEPFRPTTGMRCGSPSSSPYFLLRQLICAQVLFLVAATSIADGEPSVLLHFLGHLPRKTTAGHFSDPALWRLTVRAPDH